MIKDFMTREEFDTMVIDANAINIHKDNNESVITESLITRDKYDSTNPIYPKGVTIIETDAYDNMYKKVRIGDGCNRYFSLPCTYDSESIRDQLEYDRKSIRDQLDNERNQYQAEIAKLKNQMTLMVHGIEDKMNRSITYIHSCKSCGAKLEIPENKDIFYCKYCDSVYVVGPVRLNSTV